MKTMYKLSLCLILVAFFCTTTTEAASPEGRHGWVTSASAIIGTTTACAPNEVLVDLEILEYGTNNPITVPLATFQIFNFSNNVLSESSSGVGSVLPALCYDPAIEGIAFDIVGGSGYYNLWGGSNWENPAAVPRGMHYRQTVWLTPTSNPIRYRQLSPVGTITKINPSYSLSLASFPTTYGATAASKFKFFLVEYFPETNSLGGTIDSRQVDISGGVGTKTIIPTAGLVDGIYTWGGYLSLNGTHTMTVNSTSTFTVDRVSKTGFVSFDWPFMLDSTAPAIAITGGHVPVAPRDIDIVTLTGESTDTLAGVVQMKVFVDGVERKTCNFAAVNDALCDLEVGPYSASTTVSYFFTATDMAGNTATSSNTSFIVAAVLLPDLVAASTTVSSSTVFVGETITFSTGDIFNVDAVTAPGYALAGFYIDTNNDGAAEYEATIGSQSASTAVGASNRIDNITWTVPALAIAGTYRVGYIVNEPNSFAEISTTNNWSGWTNFIVNVPVVPVAPTVTPLTASPNPITVGDSTELSWSVSGNATWCWLAGTGGGWQDTTDGSKNIWVTPSATETYTIQCGSTAGDSAIESREVTVIPPASINLTPVGCYITASSSTCEGEVSWEFISGTAPFIVRNTTNSQVYGTSENSPSVTALLNKGTNTIIASDAAGHTRTETIEAFCSANSTWDAVNSVCVSLSPTPAVEVTVINNLVRSGVSVPLSIKITSVETLTCELINAQGTTIMFTHNPALGVLQTYTSYSTRPLTSAQVVTVSCSVDAAPTVIGTGEVRINVLGVLGET